jgi:hypothetical protein
LSFKNYSEKEKPVDDYPLHYWHLRVTGTATMPTKILTAKDFDEQEDTTISLTKSDVRPGATGKKIAPGGGTSTAGTTQELADTVATSKKKKKNKKKKNRGEACLELAIAKPGKVDGVDSNDGSAGDKEGISKSLKTVTFILELVSNSFPLFGAWLMFL